NAEREVGQAPLLRPVLGEHGRAAESRRSPGESRRSPGESRRSPGESRRSPGPDSLTAYGRPDATSVALQEVLRESGMPEELAATCAVVLPAITRLVARGADAFMRPSEAVAVAEEAAVMTSLLEGARMLAARDLAGAAGPALLARR